MPAIDWLAYAERSAWSLSSGWEINNTCILLLHGTGRLAWGFETLHYGGQGGVAKRLVIAWDSSTWRCHRARTKLKEYGTASDGFELGHSELSFFFYLSVTTDTPYCSSCMYGCDAMRLAFSGHWHTLSFASLQYHLSHEVICHTTLQIWLCRVAHSKFRRHFWSICLKFFVRPMMSTCIYAATHFPISTVYHTM